MAPKRHSAGTRGDTAGRHQDPPAGSTRLGNLESLTTGSLPCHPESPSGPGGAKPESLWKISDLADYLNVSELTIRDWILKRHIPFLKVGRHIRFEPWMIEHWLGERRVPMAPTIARRRR
jgi:excisionase family DNA binding protein